MEIRVIRAIRVLLNIEILIFFRLNIYKGAWMSTTIHQTKSYLYLLDTNIFLQTLRVARHRMRDTKNKLRVKLN